MREHDVLFLLSIVPPDSATLASWQAQGTPAKPDQLYGLTHVRGCEVIEVSHEVMSHGDQPGVLGSGKM